MRFSAWMCAATISFAFASTANAADAGPYDETADGQKQIESAIGNAQAHGKNVAVFWGANWCDWCQRLDALLRDDTDLANALARNYEVVKVDMGERTKHMELAREYGADIAVEEIPHLTILAASGVPRAQVRSDDLGPSDGQYERQKVAQVLESNKPTLPGPETGFTSLFNGKDLTGWTGDTDGYTVQNGAIVCKPGGNLFTTDEFADFVFRFEFKLTPGGNNGLGIRAPLGQDAAYHGMEIQILDDRDPQYKDIHPYQAHGSVYGIVPAKRDHLKPVGEWNEEEVIAKGRHITVIVNGATVVDADLDEALKNGAMDGKEHPGAKNASGHIGFLGHGSVVEFRNIRAKKLD